RRLRDHGPDVWAEAPARAREPLFTAETSGQGLGLGLAICDSLVRALAGELLLANHPAGGALITLPLRLASPGGNLQPSEAPSP
ncbi:ATP-binding protein, partial [Pseudomonas yangonensis]|uniref:ATP-binding protein n=1 Tax=Pseudomonas yangonensis TaxID=2579922 RepID=UPI0034D5C342